MQLKEIIKEIPSKGCGITKIPVKRLKLSSEVLGDKYLEVVNNSLNWGTVPEKWKGSVVVPIEKKKNTHTAEEFRPITILPCYEKMLELIVKKQLIQFINVNQVLTPFQAGFPEKHSCKRTKQLIIMNWKGSLDAGKTVVAVFMDFNTQRCNY